MNNMKERTHSSNVGVLCIQLSVLAKTLQLKRPDAATKEYWYTFRENERCRGIHDATLTYKHYYDNAKSICLRARLPEPIKRWIKRNKNGYPTYINKVISDLELDLNNQMHCVFLLTFFSQYEIRCTDRLKTDLDSLCTQQSSVWTKRTVSDFVRFFKNEKFLRTKIVRKGKPSSIVDFVSIKGGPYGLCTPSWIKDLIAIAGKPSIAQAVIGIEKILGYTNPLENLTNLISNLPVDKLDNTRLFRTFAIPDKGPKVRTVTCGNYYVQRALRPIHDWLMEILRSIPEDGSHTQDRAAKLVKMWTAKGYQPYCYDLTAATDRMPANLQVLIFTLLKQEWAKDWESIMRRAESFDKDSEQFFELSVGQPMGVYSSWPAFTLAHHYIIRFAFYLNEVSPKNGYAIIGDDVAILDKNVAKTYFELITGLGIQVSINKSLTPETATRPSGELAKRLFVEGKEISPIRPKVLVAIFREPQGPGLLKSFALEIIRRYPGSTSWMLLTSTGSQSPPVLQFLPKKKRNYGILVLTSPFGGIRIPLFARAHHCAVSRRRLKIVPANIVRLDAPWDYFPGWMINNAVKNMYKDVILDEMLQDLVDVKETIKKLVSFESSQRIDYFSSENEFTVGVIYQTLTSDLSINPFYNAIKHLGKEMDGILTDTIEFSASPAGVITDKLDRISVSLTLIRDWCKGKLRRDFQDAKSKKAGLLMRKAKEVYEYCYSGDAAFALSSRVLPTPSEVDSPVFINRLLGSNRQVALLGLPRSKCDES